MTMAAQHKGQRVGVFVDVQNLYYSAKQLYGAKVNFTQILKTAVAGRKLIRALCYVIRADIKEEHTFFDALEKIGYDVRVKDLQVFFGGAKKGDWDIGIAMDIMRIASKLDVVVLVSGDGDFKDLIEHVKSLGCRGEVIAFGKTASSKLKTVVDQFTDLDENKQSYLIADRSGSSSSSARALSKPAVRRPTSAGRSSVRPTSAGRSSVRPTSAGRSSVRSTFAGRSSTRPAGRSRSPVRGSTMRRFEPSAEMTPQQRMIMELNMDQPDKKPIVKATETAESKKEPKKQEKTVNIDDLTAGLNEKADKSKPEDASQKTKKTSLLKRMLGVKEN